MGKTNPALMDDAAAEEREREGLRVFWEGFHRRMREVENFLVIKAFLEADNYAREWKPTAQHEDLARELKKQKTSDV